MFALSGLFLWQLMILNLSLSMLTIVFCMGNQRRSSRFWTKSFRTFPKAVSSLQCPARCDLCWRTYFSINYVTYVISLLSPWFFKDNGSILCTLPCSARGTEVLYSCVRDELVITLRSRALPLVTLIFRSEQQWGNEFGPWRRAEAGARTGGNGLERRQRPEATTSTREIKKRRGRRTEARTKTVATTGSDDQAVATTSGEQEQGDDLARHSRPTTKAGKTTRGEART